MPRMLRAVDTSAHFVYMHDQADILLGLQDNHRLEIPPVHPGDDQAALTTSPGFNSKKIEAPGFGNPTWQIRVMWT